MKTTRGIYLDIKESEYSFKVNKYRFYFSSVMYRDKFIDEHKDFLKYEKIKFNNSYRVKLMNDDIFLFTLYGKIEKRGYYVYDCEEKVEIREIPSAQILI